MPKIKILIASSSKVLGLSLSRSLRNQNYEPMLLTNGIDVLKHLRKGEVDVCLLQATLPVLSGLDVHAQFSQTATSRKTPIILFSSQANIEKIAQEKGAVGFLKLPCRPRELLELVKSVLAKKTRILLVDDSPVAHQKIGTALRENDFEVIEAFNGEEGLRKAIEFTPDLIITDLVMPQLDGYELCERIKSTPSTEHIPVIMLSVHGSGIDIDKGFDVGANDFLAKPINTDELLSRINLILEGSNTQLREKILVVDDEKIQLNVMSQGLTQQGFRVITATNGREALEATIQQEPDLVITDLIMPIMNGRDFCREIRLLDRLSDIPVIMLTYSESDLDRVKGEHAGVTAYLKKPFQPEKLVVIVEKLIAERRLLRERQIMRRYLPESAASVASDMALANNTTETMRADEVFITILFLDIVGFTPLCEHLKPRQVLKQLNEYFDVMTAILKKNSATIDKFIGDAIMALYIEDRKKSRRMGAYDAIKSGLEMLAELGEFNRNRKEKIQIRVGINSGKVIMGDIGSKLYRRDYTVIGDTVNVAQRLEKAAPHDSILISESTYDLVHDVVEVKELGPLSLKGKQEKFTVYQLMKLHP